MIFILKTTLQNHQAKIAGTIIAGYWFALWGLPDLAALLAVLVAALTTGLMAARVAAALTEEQIPPQEAKPDEPFVSIHIPTYAEPPEVVKDTLDSLVDLDYEAYEVIVLDNNTPDPELYEPVREHCEKLGKRFRFFHYDDVKGAKAGALNISLELCDEDTEHILVLDADYRCRPEILKTGVSHFVAGDIGLVQFPQAYRNSGTECGLTLEYKHFFDLYMNLANQAETVLSTGTAAFINKTALMNSGGWSGETLTEDAELGLRLHQHGYRVVYAPEEVAAGLMPTDLAGFREQRRRWIVGNAQSLGTVLWSSRFSWDRKLCMILQLTAWTTPLLLPVIELLLASIVGTFQSHPALSIVVDSALWSLTVYFLGTATVFGVWGRREGFTPLASLKALLVHLGTVIQGSLCWCEIFLGKEFEFIRTNKFITEGGSTNWLRAAVPTLLFAISTPYVVTLGSNVLTTLWVTGLSIATGHTYLCYNIRQIRERTRSLG